MSCSLTNPSQAHSEYREEDEWRRSCGVARIYEMETRRLWSGSTSAATQSRRGKCVNTHVMLQVSVLDTLSVERRSLFYKLELTCDDQCRREEEGGTGAQLCCIMILSFSVVSLFSVKTFSRYDLNGGAKNLFNEARTRSLRPWR